MDLENRFVVGVPLEAAWSGLLDIPLVVECLPGATLTGTVDATTYTGTVRVRLGPIAMEFAGRLQVESVDHAAHRAMVRATWNETRNRGSAASASVLEATSIDTGAEVIVRTRVDLAGQIAQYGRGVGVIQAVSVELVRQFAANLQAKLEARRPEPAAASAASPAAAPAASSAASAPPGPSAPAFARGEPEAISPLALLRAAFMTWWRGLRARR